MPFCSNCGTEIESGAFCPNCGTKLEVDIPVQEESNVKVNNLKENPNILCTDKLGCFEVYEYQKDISVNPSYAQIAYFMHKMNFRKRQVLCTLNGNAIKTQGGAMQWTAGRVLMDADVKGVKDFLGKAIKGAVSGESASKPIYHGNGYVMLEPTYNYIIFEDLTAWGSGMVVEDGMFLACDMSVQEEIVSRGNISSALLGGEGLFNLSLSGNGIVVLESTVPREELVEIVLDNDEVRIDGNMAVAWSKSLEFTVEKSTKSLVGSFVSGEGFVNVYRGTGKVLMAPVAPGTTATTTNQVQETGKTSSAGLVSSIASTVLDL